MVRWRGRRGGGTSCGSTSECEGNGSDCFFFFFFFHEFPWYMGCLLRFGTGGFCHFCSVFLVKLADRRDSLV